MKAKGFTLIELIVVIAIIAILGAIISPNAFRAIEKARVSAFVADYKTVKNALLSYYSDTGRWPTNYQDLNPILITGAGQASGWDGPYVEKLEKILWWGSAAAAWRWIYETGRWDTDSNFEGHFCYEPPPTATALVAIDRAVDGGDGYDAGSIKGGWRQPFGASGCFWPLVFDD